MTQKRDENSSSSDKKAPATGLFSGYLPLYAFCDKVDAQLMFTGVISGIFLTVIPPFVWIIMGKFVNVAVQHEIDKMLNASLPSNSFNSSILHLDNNIQEINHNDSQIFFKWCLILSSVMFFCAFFQRLSWEFTAIRQVFRIKSAYVKKLLHMDVSWLESRHSGQVAAMLHEHADSIHAGISEHVPQSFYIMSYMSFILALCLYLKWDVTLLMCSAIPLMILVRVLFSKWYVSTIDQENLLEKKIANLVSETFSCIRTVISFGAQKQTINKFERYSIEHSQLAEGRTRSSSVFDSLCQVLLTEFVFSVALFYGVYMMDSSEAGTLCALVINFLYMCTSSITIGFHFTGMKSAKINAAQMEEILNEAPLIENDPCLPIPEKRESPSGKGSIRFDNVFFSYPSRPDVEVLKGISFSVAEGEHLAIVGSSGSGKSTLTALLLRFYDLNHGKIEFGDVEINRMSADDVRSECALVSQEPVLFDGTIGDNIRYGRLDATQNEINDAARRVGAWSFISALPEGMQTRVGDRGMQLSGGQKQRVAIARAVLRRPKVIVFDEATSALDTKHEEEVQEALEAAARGITSITIAHRLSTIKTADRIIVLDDGMIVEQGAPDELLANENGRMFQLFNAKKEFYRMYHDQVLDQLAATVPLPPPGALNSAMSFSPADTTLDAETHRRAWNRSSLGAHKKLGKSYSVRSRDREKLTLPVVSRKRSIRADLNYTTNQQIELADKLVDDVQDDGGPTTFRSVVALVRRYRSGWSRLAAAIPITAIRSVFLLLICFQISDAIEIFTSPTNDMKNDRLLLIGSVYIALIIVKTAFEAVGRFLISSYGNGISAFLRVELFRSILRHGAAFFDEEQNTPGRLTHKVVNDTNTLGKLLSSKMDLFIPGVVCSFASVFIAAFYSWKLTLLCSFQFPAYVVVRIIQIRQTAKRQRQMLEEERKAANLSTVVLTNMSTIKAYGLQSHFMEVFQQTLQPLKSAMKRQSLVSAFVYASQTSFMYILISASIALGDSMLKNGEVNIFNFIRVVLLTQFGSIFCSQLVSSVAEISKAKAAGEGILSSINERPREMDNLTEEGLRPKVRGDISMESVEFRYPTRPIIPVLRNINLHVREGESVAIVGPSGSGKSSIFALLQRMYTATNGEIKLDNVNVKAINPAYLRRVVVSVGQEPTLFSFTIRENIAFGLIGTEGNQDRVENAARVANIHDFIVSLPQGYDTEVGEFGAQLSGGQKQRIAIARAIIREPAVLLLDEATAALDTQSEKAVQTALEKASKMCTCIQIAHRLSTIRNVDRIIVLVDGAIAEEGSHRELMQKKGLYYEMNQSA